jgi:hypothetical protein
MTDASVTTIAVIAEEKQRTSLLTKYVMFALTAVIVVRFFSETVPVLPKLVQFIDIPLVTLGIVLAIFDIVFRECSVDSRGYLTPIYVVLAVGLFSAAFSASRIETAPMVLFLYGLIGPPVFFLVLLISGRVSLHAIPRLLWWLGVINIVSAVVVGMPMLIATGDPDRITGTFGNNAYQFTFFIGLWALYELAGYLFDRATAGRGNALRVLVVLFAVFGLFYAAQYKAMLVFFPLSIVVCVALSVGSPGGKFNLVIFSLAIGIAMLFTVASYFPGLKLLDTFQLASDPQPVLDSGKLAAVGGLLGMYGQYPLYSAIGSGPGTFGSRGYRTFASGETGRGSDTAGATAMALTGGVAYETDVAQRYIRSIIQAPIQGGTQLSTPYTSYVSIPGELGIIGFVAVIWFYGLAFRRTLKAQALSLDTKDRVVFAASFTAAGGILLLASQCLFDNWAEMTRVTFPLWMLILVAEMALASAPAEKPAQLIEGPWSPAEEPSS